METAAALAVAWFNDGADSVKELYRTISLPVGTHTARLLAALDVQRIQAAERKAVKEEKGARKRRRRVRKGVEDEEREAEGVTYEAGAFD